MDASVDRPLISVSVLVVAPTASTTHANPEVNVLAAYPAVLSTHVSPEVSISCMVPALKLSYIEIAAFAGMDDSGRYQYKADMTAVVDDVRFSLAKGFSDSIAFSDSSIVQTDKGLSETATLSDIVQTVLIFIRDFADAQNLTDVFAVSFAKAVVDAVAMDEGLTFSTSKALDDLASVAEIASLTVAKSLIDTYATVDAASISAEKIFSDATILAEAAVLQAQKVVDESVSFTESQMFETQKTVDDGVSMNDGFGANDGLDFSFTTSTANITFATDDFSQTIGKLASDSVAFTDGGLIVQQDYCDLSYFAEDYVGTAFIF